MATRLYFHEAQSVLANLPTSEQSSLTPTNSTGNPEAFTINRTMDTTKGTTQTAKALTSGANTSTQQQYFTRFVSPQFDSAVTSVTAQTWTYSISTKTSNASANFPIDEGGGPSSIRAVVYVWRPGTGKVANVRDGTTAANVLEASTANQFSDVTTFTGALVSSTQAGDVLVCELWAANVVQAASSSYTNTYYYDGSLVPTDDAQETNVACYLETPQNLTFAPLEIDMTQASAKTYANKFITKT